MPGAAQTAERHPSGRSISDLPPDALDAVARLVDHRSRPSMRLSCRGLRQASDRSSREARVRIPWTSDGLPVKLPGTRSLRLLFLAEDSGHQLPEALECFPAAREVTIVAWWEWLSGPKVSCVFAALRRVRSLRVVGRVLPCAVGAVPRRVERLDARLAVCPDDRTWALLRGLTSLRSLRMPVDGRPDVSAAVGGMSRLTSLVCAAPKDHRGLGFLPPSLASLRLSGGRLPSLAPVLALPGLSSLDLSHTHGVLDYSPLSSLSSLTSLCLSRCGLTGPEATAIMSGLKRLEHADLEMNSLEGWDDPPDFPRGLRTVYLSYCALPRAVARKASALRSLRTVEAYRTGLTEADFRPLEPPIVRV